jgi:hypothetical protein
VDTPTSIGNLASRLLGEFVENHFVSWTAGYVGIVIYSVLLAHSYFCFLVANVGLNYWYDWGGICVDIEIRRS